jgi:hypothetical protein
VPAHYGPAFRAGNDVNRKELSARMASAASLSASVGLVVAIPSRGTEGQSADTPKTCLSRAYPILYQRRPPS